MSDYTGIRDIADLKTVLFGLAVECPMGNNPSDCQIHHIRLLPMQERYEWVEKLSNEQCVEYYEYHKKCLARKEKLDG